MYNLVKTARCDDQTIRLLKYILYGIVGVYCEGIHFLKNEKYVMWKHLSRGRKRKRKASRSGVTCCRFWRWIVLLCNILEKKYITKNIKICHVLFIVVFNLCRIKDAITVYINDFSITRFKNAKHGTPNGFSFLQLIFAGNWW